MSADDRRLIDGYDCLMLDLDGVVYVGPHAVAGVPEILDDARGRVSLAYVTNNASRTPDEVADQLDRLGVTCAPSDVVTSAQAAAREIALRCRPGAEVFVVGGRGLEVALTEHGLVPVRSLGGRADAVAQGFSQDLGWRDLAEASYLLADSEVVWVASNTDRSLPTERGVAPGNGTLVDAVAAATGRRPDSVAGKPFRPLFDETVERVGSNRPLMVGDRLDTDIAGGVRCEADTLLVLTGVTDARQACLAGPGERPTHIGSTLDVLQRPYVAPRRVGDAWQAAGWTAGVDAGRLDLDGTGDPDLGLRAAAAACWEAMDAGVDDLDVSAVDHLRWHH